MRGVEGDDDENRRGRAGASAGNAATYPGMRWGILALACAVLFGNYYAYDLIASVALPLQAHFGFNDAEWSYWVQALYSIYSVPNLVLPLVVGAVNDQVGTRTVLLVLSLLIVIGQALVAIGVTVKSMILAMFGRLVFGIGGESLSVAQTRLTAKWFNGKEMAFALGVNLRP